jgi:hypothetical protein
MSPATVTRPAPVMMATLWVVMVTIYSRMAAYGM